MPICELADAMRSWETWKWLNTIITKRFTKIRLLDKGWLMITEFYYKKGDYKKALHYINKALNIDGDNPDYWKKCGKIHVALRDFDNADFAYKHAIDMGNYELDTWFSWAEVSKLDNNLDTALGILSQCQEFFPGSRGNPI